MICITQAEGVGTACQGCEKRMFFDSTTGIIRKKAESHSTMQCASPTKSLERLHNTAMFTRENNKCLKAKSRKKYFTFVSYKELAEKKNTDVQV